jgi:tRNA(adenine34) deaminase
MTDEYFMQFALKEARKAFDSAEVPVGAVVVQNDRVIARGSNQVEQLNDPTAHAEMIALTSAFNFLGSKYLPEATIYVTVEPCIMCAGAMYWSKISRIVYGTADDKNGYRRFCACQGEAHTGTAEPWPFHPKTQLTAGILSDECAALMKDFFKARR